MDSLNAKVARVLHVKGRVQAVGFRPFVWKLASGIGLTGFVFNQPDGVIIHIEGTGNKINEFISLLKSEAPPASIIKSIDSKEVSLLRLDEFQIEKSNTSNEFVTEVCPDIAICNDCLKELSENDRRKNYPFINCTNCGPRFTLIEDFPYDRPLTTMSEFEMCPTCKQEYLDPADRRFHAQPTSCFSCGPNYSYRLEGNKIYNTETILNSLAQTINSGKVIAIKGLGGYNLVCDAGNDEAVQSIRKFKNRDKKPFAVMFRDLKSIKTIVDLDKEEEEIITSWRRPILIAKQQEQNVLSKYINSGLQSLGVFLPYMPLHYLLFEKLESKALVVTSGNESDTPILHTESDALSTFQNIDGGVLINNRKIARRCDDSVVKVIQGKPQIIRRARGYVPAPVDLYFDVDGILATGAELSNCFCLGKGKQAIMSQHIGDLKNLETHNFFYENIDVFNKIYRFNPKHIVCDLHPDYLSTQYAKKSDLPILQVQHHHAHIAAVMAEHNLKNKVIGLAFDGTGLGTDGNIWGSEVFIADFNGFKRISHFEYVAMPGGDRVTKEPWRSGLAYLMKAFTTNWKELSIPFLQQLDSKKIEAIEFAIQKEINAPLSCSTGRLFDAVASILAVCIESNYHAKAPMLLEDLTSSAYLGYYAFSGTEVISFSKTIQGIVEDIKTKVSVNEIASKFHNTLALAIVHQVDRANKESGLNRVAMSGGTFQNKYLTEKLVHLLEEKNFEVFLPEQVPSNDAGIALGQLAIAAHKF